MNDAAIVLLALGWPMFIIVLFAYMDLARRVARHNKRDARINGYSPWTWKVKR